jgi:hypothetical protein
MTWATLDPTVVVIPHQPSLEVLMDATSEHHDFALSLFVSPA